MKFKSLLSITSSVIILLNSCTKNPLEDFNSSSEAMKVIADVSNLSRRTSIANAGPITIVNKMAGSKLLANTTGSSNELFKPEIGLELIKEIFPPTINGVLVRVTHVAILGNYAYVGYNREGDVRAGAIDILDISNINDVKLIKQIGLPNMDISTVYAEDSLVHFSGAADVGPIKGIATPAVVGYFNNTYNNPTLANLQSFLGTTATDFVLDGNHKYIVSGSNGELVKIRKSDNEIEGRVTIPGLLAVRTNDNHVIALTADNGLMIYTKDLTFVKRFTTIKNNVEHKRHIQVDNTNAYVAEGTAGLGIYDLNTSELKNRITIPTNVKDFPFVSQSEVTTIAVSFDNNRAFVANGAGGISIYKYGNDKSQWTYLGSADLNFFQNPNIERAPNTVDSKEISSNYILAKDNIVFVAGGRGGLKILKLKDLTTTPEPIVGGCIDCSNTILHPNAQSVGTQNSNGTAKYGTLSSDLTTTSDAFYTGQLSVTNNINLNNNLTWCGKLEGQTFNSNGNNNKFTLSGDLKLTGNLTISTMEICGSAVIDNRTNLNTNGTGLILKTNSTFTTKEIDVNTRIIVEEGGKLNTTGANSEFKINSNAVVELGNSTELKIEGNLMNSNTTTIGLTTASNSLIIVNGQVNTNNVGSTIKIGSNSIFTVYRNYENNAGKLVIGNNSTVTIHGNLYLADNGSVEFGSNSVLKVYGAFNANNQNATRYTTVVGNDSNGSYKLITLK